MKKTIGKRLLSAVTALLTAATYMLPSSLSVFAADFQADTENAYNLSTGENYSKSTLLAGNSDLKKDTIDETIKAYQERYLLGVAADFCVFLEEDFDIRDCDAEGRVAVGGNFLINTAWGNYTVGAGDYGYYSSLGELINDRSGSATVVIGKQLKGMLNDVYYGPETWDDGYNKKYEGQDYDENGNPIHYDMHDHPQQEPEHKTDKKLVLNNDSAPGWVTDNEIPATSVGNWQKVDRTQTYVGEVFSFKDAFDYMRDTVSDSMITGAAEQTALTNVYTADGGETICFEWLGDDTAREYVYFTLSEDQYDAFRNAKNIKYINIPELPEPRTVVENLNDNSEVGSVEWKYAYIVVNVMGTGEYGEYNNNVLGQMSGDFYHIANVVYNDNEKKYEPVRKTTYINDMNTPISNQGDLGWKEGVAAQQTNNDPGVTSLIYHFVEAENVVMGGNFAGTVYAPKSFVTDEEALRGGVDTKHGHLSGALVAKKFTGYTEFGFRTFAGPALSIAGKYNVVLSKVDSDNNTPLNGAEFKLWKKNGNTWVDVTAETLGITGDNAANARITAGTDIVIEGLAAGEYYLEETQAPDGYPTPTGEDAKTYFTISEDGDSESNTYTIETGEYEDPTAHEYEVGQTLPDGTKVPEDADNYPEKYIPAGLAEEVSETFNLYNNAISFASPWNAKFSDVKIVVYYLETDEDGNVTLKVDSYDDIKDEDIQPSYWAPNIKIYDKDNVVAVTLNATAPTTGNNWDEFSFTVNNVKTTVEQGKTYSGVVLGTMPKFIYYVVAEDNAEFTATLDSGEVVYADQGAPKTIKLSTRTVKAKITSKTNRDGTTVTAEDFDPLNATYFNIEGKTYKLKNGIITSVGSRADGVSDIKMVSVGGGYAFIYKINGEYKAAVPIPVVAAIKVGNSKTIVATTSVSVTKKWQYGTTDAIPEGVDRVELKVTIKKGETDVTDDIITDGSKTITLTEDSNGKWEWSQDGLPAGTYTVEIISETVYDTEGNDITSKFSKTDNGPAQFVTITNYYIEEMGDLQVTKAWTPFERGTYKFDNYPEITFTLTSNAGYGPITKDLTDLKATFDNLPVYKYTVENGVLKKGAAIIYTLTEIDVDGYTSSINTSDKKWSFTLEELTEGVKAVTVTNEYSKTGLTIDKEWAGFEKTHPTSITVNVIGTIVVNGEKQEIYKEEVTIEGDADAAKWTQKSVTGLPTHYYDENGKVYQISYDIEEVTPDDYVSEKNNTGGAFTLKNTYVGGTTSFTVKKTWDDNNDVLGFRPDKVIVHVQITKTDANGTTTDVINEDVTLYEKDGWEKKFGNYQIYADKTDLNSKLTYEIKVTETNPPDAYVLESITTDTNTNIVTVNNKYKNDDAGTKFEINKEWSDTVPEGAEVTVHVVIKNDIDETTVYDSDDDEEPIILKKGGNDGDWYWTTEGKGLSFPKYSVNAKGEVVESTYTMTVTEISVTIDGTTITVGQSNYFRVDYFSTTGENSVTWSKKSATAGNDDNTATITIRNTYAMTDLEIEKNWDANGFADEEAAFRPKDEITVHVVGRVDGVDDPVYEDNVTLNNNNTNKWTATKSLPKYYKDGSVIKYEITESLPGYTPTGVGAVTGNNVSITNKYDQETTDVSVTKVWDDDDASLRPDSITLTVTIMQGNKQYGEPITVTLPDDGEIVDGKWVWTMDNLPKYSDVAAKTEYKYTVAVEEEAVPAYELTDETGNGTDAHVTLTNTCINKETGAQFEVNKVWTDGDLDHTNDEVKVYLNISNGVNDKPITEAMITLNKDNGWKWSSTSLSLLKFPAYAIADDGKTVKACTYTMTVTEVSVDGVNIDDYTVTYKAGSTETNSVKFTSGVASITITNKLKTLKTVEATATKIWNDHNNVKGQRPTTDGFKSWIVVKDKDGNTVAVDKSQIEVLPSVGDSNSWSVKVTDLPDDGKDGASYTITEDAAKLGKYTSKTSDDGKTITNTLADEGDFSVSVKKTWTYGVAENRPTEAEFEITIWGVYGANNTKVDVTSKYIEAAADGKYYITTKNGEWKLENLPEYGYDGETEVLFTGYVIKVTEQEIEGYTPDDIEDNGEAADLTVNNRFDGLEGTASVSINKVWEDNDGKWLTRPTDAEFISWFVVKQDGKTYTLPEGITPVLEKTDDNHWKITVNGLPKYKDAFNGEEYKYTIVEVISDEYKGLYKSETTPDGKTVTNTLNASGDFSVSVKKEWNHGTNAAKPAEIAKIKVEIFGTTDGKDIDVTKVYADKLSYDEEGNYYYITISGNDVTKTISGLPKYGYDADGAARVFTGYKVKATEIDPADDYEPSYSSEEAANSITVYNTFNLDQGSVTVSGKKTWVDNGDALGVRPKADKFTVVLYADGVEQSIKPTWKYDGNVWTYTFADLPAKNANNKPIVYTVKEVYDSPYYTSGDAVKNGTNGYDFTNTIKTTSVSGKKTWVDNGDALGVRPKTDKFTVVLYADGVAQDIEPEWTYNGNVWTYTFTDLLDGKDYTVEEVYDSPYYTSGDAVKNDTNGYDFTNTIKDVKAVFAKVNANGDYVKDAVLAVYAVNGTERVLIERWTTDNAPHEIINKLTPGKTYVLVEEEAPKGYAYAEDIEFTMPSDGTLTKTVTMEDLETEVRVSKLDGESADKQHLKGATLAIYTLDGELIDQWTTTDGSYILKGILVAGQTYVLRELEAPNGYYVGAEQKFTVSMDGTPTIVEFVNYKTTVQVTKYDEDNKILGGAVLQILDKDGNVVEQWTSGDTAHTIKGLIAGETYTLHELTAPKGYQIAADVTFTVNDDGTVTVVSMVDKLIVDNKVEGEDDDNDTDTDGDDDEGKRPTGSEDEGAPKTGDPINGVLPIAIIALAMASLVMRKKEEK